MKKRLLLVLAIGMAANAFAQPEVSEKWVITPVTTMKGVLGRLDINFPADIERNILIYQQADNKFLRSVSHNDKIYTIAPGEYRFTLTNVPIENVPIKKGHETRLRAGFLDIVSEGDWHLYDETKEKAYTSGNKPRKLALPVGRYQIKLGGQFYPVVIKDGETVEDYTPVEFNGGAQGPKVPKPIETDTYVMTPINEPTESGRFSMQFACDNIPVRIYIRNAADPYGQYVYTCDDLSYCPESYTLPEGKYNIDFSIVLLKDIPILKGYETRLKAGCFRWLSQGNYLVYDKSMKIQYLAFHAQYNYQYTILPVGHYQVVLRCVGTYLLESKDGEIFEMDVEEPPMENRWLIAPINKSDVPIKPKMGRLNTYFPSAENHSMTIRLPKSDGTGYYTESILSVKSIDLLPGKYLVHLNNEPVEVPIQEGKETRIKVGNLNLFIGDNVGWFLYRGSSQGLCFSWTGKKVIALPVGFYKLWVRVNEKTHLIKINEGESVFCRWEEN